MPTMKIKGPYAEAISNIFWLHVFLAWVVGFGLVCRYWIAPFFP